MENFKKVLLGLSAGVGIGVIFVGGFFLSAWILMLLGNVVLSHFGIKTLDFTASMALVGLLVMFNSASNYNRNNE